MCLSQKDYKFNEFSCSISTWAVQFNIKTAKNFKKKIELKEGGGWGR